MDLVYIKRINSRLSLIRGSPTSFSTKGASYF